MVLYTKVIFILEFLYNVLRNSVVGVVIQNSDNMYALWMNIELMLVMYKVTKRDE